VASLVQFLAEDGAIAMGAAGWTLREGVVDGRFEVPENVRGIIRRKLERLDPLDRAALEYGAVMGREFLSTIVAAPLGMEELALEERLDPLDRVRRLIDTRREEELPDGSLATRYRFVNALYQSVLYDDLVSKKRMRMHGQVGEQLVRRYGAQATREAPALALHFERARDFQAAVTHLARAGDNAASLYAQAEAREYYTRALALAEKLAPAEQAERVALLHQKLGGVHFATGRFDAAIDSYDRMLESARAAGSAAREFAALDGLCRTLFFAHRTDEMVLRAEEALRAAERSGIAELRTESLLLVAMILQDAGDLAGCRALLDEATDSARGLGHKPALLGALAYRGIVHYWQTEYAAAERRLAEALSLTEELRDGFHNTLCLWFLGLSRGNLGRISDALDALGQATAMARRNGDRYWLPRMLNQIGWVYREVRDFEGAISRDREGLAIARAEGTGEAQASALVNLALDYTHAGRLEAAATALDEAQSASARDQWFAWMFGIRLLGARAEHALAVGDLPAAERWATELIERSRSHEARTYVASGHMVLAEVERARGRLDSTLACLGEALSALEDRDAPLAAWQAHVALARAHAARGDDDAAAAAKGTAGAILTSIADSIRDEALKASFLGSAAVREALERRPEA
ncbi:MAG TPA: hypothetical protein VEN47_01095, partial [Myxococcota bacterium]|nr:hypothetical protein [Myxococcota bacterium]